VSRVGAVPEVRALCIARTIPDGARQEWIGWNVCSAKKIRLKFFFKFNPCPNGVV
jgi:hypothetical protein